jgi:Predicted membrane protein
MSLINSIIDFIQQYYIDPIINDSGYNIFNTVTWAIILGIAVYFLIYFLQKMNIKIDAKSMAATFPFVIAGASLRVVADSGAISPPFSYILITPNIYFFVFLVTAACLIFALLLQKYKLVKTFHQVYAALGILFILVVYAVLFSVCTIANWYVPFAVGIVGISIVLIVYLIAKKFGSSIFSDKLNLMILGAHMMDATSTVIGIEVFGYVEKHVLPAYLIELTGSAYVMYPLKIAIFLIVILLLDKGLESAAANENEKDRAQLGQIKNAIKFVIIILGIAPAIRNSIRLMFGI